MDTSRRWSVKSLRRGLFYFLILSCSVFRFFSCRFDLLFCCAGRASVYPSLIKTVSGKMEVPDSQTAGTCPVRSYCKCARATLRPGTSRLSHGDLTENKVWLFCPTPPKLRAEQEPRTTSSGRTSTLGSALRVIIRNGQSYCTKKKRKRCGKAKQPKQKPNKASALSPTVSHYLP